MRVDVLVDEDVAGYADFSKEEMVLVMPHPPQSAVDFKKRAYEIAKTSNAHCHSILGKAKRADPGVPLRQGTELDTDCAGQHSFNRSNQEVFSDSGLLIHLFFCAS